MRIFQRVHRGEPLVQSSQFSPVAPLPNPFQTEGKHDEMNALTLISFNDGFRNAIYRQNGPHLEMRICKLNGK